MFETEEICPYTGLRSFTEEESLYFKGREEDIDQATEQLQRNKFLMLTGASGDGKSSLIYAGIIPNARAGFLKSKYTQWCVADCRPERTPFRNLCRAIAKQLGISNVATVQSELSHGFSAIIDLYKSSKRYIDTSSSEWQSADENARAAMRRDAANLIILVDQFEEFFTNPENYHKGVPSGDAILVLNLLLETAQIALEEDLPVYVVFTMRSDFIGQCAAFRGLPEYIGFSQFFVPRLNRTQLQQVIEEPATLSGNRISRRLTERLILDLTEGVDQLPILQHALNQIWHAASNGREEMDLVHYAMVGGMPESELPDEQVSRFHEWFQNLPPHIKACYHKPDLQNVLDTHTNKLYEQAANYYLEKTGKQISDSDAKSIIRTAFICLTKIDQSRAVRNRMTLREITNIMGKTGFDAGDVGAVLNIFREPGNTFIRPFILDDPASQQLQETDVLDITHESLIRNWAYLEQWAKEEFETYTISLDFEQQLNRWVESDKSKGFLLPIGPLTYFENWFNKAKPNAYWIARYLPEEIEQEKKLSRAKQILGNMQEFLKRSADRHVVTRTIMRYGPKRIAVLVGLIGILVLSSFAVRNYFRKQNDNVLKSIKESTFEIANVTKLSPEFPVPAITEQLILGNITIAETIDAITDQHQKIKIATAIATQLISQGRKEPRKEIFESLAIADSLLNGLQMPSDNRKLSEALKLIHDYSVTAGFAFYISPDDSIRAMVMSNAKLAATWSMKIFTEQPAGFSDIQFLSLALENAINHKIFSQEEISRLLQLLSPFENTTRTPWLEENYHRDKVLVRGNFNYGPRFNGLYQELAYLYAAAGKPDMVLQCMDTLLAYQANFYQNDYSTYIENASHIAAVFHIYGQTEFLDVFAEGYSIRKNISREEFYNHLLSRAMPEHFITGYSFFYAGGGGQGFTNMNLYLSSDELLTFFNSKLREDIMKVSNPDERNFKLACMLKNQGVAIAARKEIRETGETGTDIYFKEAVSYYQLVSDTYLDQQVNIVGAGGADIITSARKFLFLYPDYRVPFHPNEPRNLIYFYYSPAFLKYALDNNYFDQLYSSGNELSYFENWLICYQVIMCSRNFFFSEPIPPALMDRLAQKLEEKKANQYADLNILYLHMAEQAFEMDDTAKGIASLEKIQPDKLLNAFQYKNYNFVNSYSLELVGKGMAGLASVNRFDVAFKLLNVFKKEVNRSSLYAYASQLLTLKKMAPEAALQLLDSARAEMNRLDNPAEFQPNRHQVAMALMYMDPDKNAAEAYRIIKNSPQKFAAISRFAKAHALNDHLHKARQQAPSLISTEDKAAFIRYTVDGFSLRNIPDDKWSNFRNNEMLFTRRFLPYINENE